MVHLIIYDEGTSKIHNPCSKIMITFDVGQHEDKYRLIYVLLCLD